jgi:hypothetical protein
MTHPMEVGAFVWSSIIDVVSEHRRAYALDTIGDIGKSELSDPARYPKTGRGYSGWLDDAFTGLDVTSADIVTGSMGGWMAMNRARHARRPRAVYLPTTATNPSQARRDHHPIVG